ncbi:hypothetical protein C4Y95_003385 [Klebsiella pneumoniae subsp. pneumoniae]|nr:hypothetical protein C4Y95_003385 [Klebsiella pneumoniae subsp. pneumoniae]
MTAADGGECNIQKQSRAKKASSRREQLLTDSAGEEKHPAHQPGGGQHRARPGHRALRDRRRQRLSRR